MPLNRIGVVGSAVGAIVLGMVLTQSSTPTPVSPAPPRQVPSNHRAAAHPVAQSSAAVPEQLPEDGPWQASREHFAGVQAGRCASLQDVNGRWCVPENEKVQAVIAILPNPVVTHMGLVFDRSVEAIQLAAESMNYVVDRYWLPWDNTTKLEWQDYDSQQKAEENAEQTQLEPGLLLFRWNGEAGQGAVNTLFIFVVSETSTAGVDGEQFSRALEYRKVLCSQGKCPAAQTDADRIEILGPTFSGSLDSLVRLTRRGKFNAFSGTASSTCAAQNQHLAHHSQLCDPISDKDALDDHLQFHDFVSDTESAVISLLALLKLNHEIDCTGHAEVAILAEASTTYGAVQRRFAGAFQNEDEDENDKTSGQNSQTLKDCSTSFSYPREISTLRNAYDKSQAAAAAANANAGKSSLPFDLREQPTNKSDEPPAFSASQGPISKEAVLMKLASELRQSEYKYIGVIGSNVLDVLFLTSFLRKSCPDARLFVVHSDLLFERELDNAPYIGTLTISTYPLVARNLDWTSTAWPNASQQVARLPFADQFEEGQYNAFLQGFLDVMPQKTGTRQPAFYERHEPFVSDTAKVPMWLTTVGTGGYWPVQLLSPPGGSTASSSPPAESVAIAKPVLQESDFSSGWKVIMALLCGLSLLHIWILLTAAPTTWALRDFSLLMPQVGQRLFFLHSASAILAVSLVMVSAPAFLFGQHTVQLTALESAVVLATFGLLLSSRWMHINGQIRRKWDMEKNKEAGKTPKDLKVNFWIAIAVWAGASVAICIWFVLLVNDPAHLYGFFFAYRAVNLATGISPLTPILPLLAAIYIWCIFELRRLRFNEKLRPKLKAQSRAPGWRSERLIANSVSRYLLGWYYIAGLIVLFLIWLLLFNPVHPFQLFEKAYFGPFFEVLFCLGVVVLLSSGFRLGQLWANLRKLLLELERSPIRDAFDRLKGFSWSPIWRQRGEESERLYLMRSLEAMRRIKYGDGKLDESHEVRLVKQVSDNIEAVETSVKNIETTMDALYKENTIFPLARMNRDRRLANHGAARLFFQLEENLHEIQERLADVLQEIWSVLERRWNEGHFISDHGDNKADSENKKDEKPETVRQLEKDDSGEEQIQRMEEFAALRYVSFIRGALGHIRYLLIFLGICFTLVLISLNVYSFEPHQSLRWAFTAIFVVIGLLILMVVAQVHRDRILSRITDTKPNELGIEFYVRIISVGIVPLLTLLATHFPAIGRSLLSLLQPGLEALK